MTIELQDVPMNATGDDDAGLAPADQRLAAVMSPKAMDELLADAQAAGIAVDGPGGLIQQMVKAVLERALDVEMADYLGHDKGDRKGAGRAGTPATGSPPRR